MPKQNVTQDADFLTKNIKSLLQEKLWLLEDRLQKKKEETPYKSLSDAESKVLASLRGEELTISEVARRLGVSRQAVHKTVSNLVDAGLLELNAVEGNLRDKTIGFTAAGEKMKKEAGRILQELDQGVEQALGKDNFQQLKILLGQEW